MDSRIVVISIYYKLILQSLSTCIEDNTEGNNDTLYVSLWRTCLEVERYREVSSLCLGTPTSVSWPLFGYEDYDERRIFANKFDSVFTEFRNKWEIGGRLFREVSRNIEWCKASCLFFSSFNEYMHLTVKLGTVPINFVQSMRLNIDVVQKIRKVEQDRRTHLYSPTLKCLGLPLPSNVLP